MTSPWQSLGVFQVTDPHSGDLILSFAFVIRDSYLLHKWALQVVDRLTPVQSHPGVHTRVSTDYDTHPDSRDVNVKRMGTLELTADIFMKIGYKVEGYFHQRPGIIKNQVEIME